jgi:hypothetical protein
MVNRILANSPKEDASMLQLIRQLVAIKEAEKNLASRRIDLENQLAKLINKDNLLEGTLKVSEGNFKVSVEYKLNRKIDVEQLEIVGSSFPTGMVPVRYKPEIDLKKLRVVEQNPALASLCSMFITTSPAKPYVKIEEV